MEHEFDFNNLCAEIIIMPAFLPPDFLRLGLAEFTSGRGTHLAATSSTIQYKFMVRTVHINIFPTY